MISARTVSRTGAASVTAPAVAVRKALRELRDKGLIALGDQELAAVDFHGDVVPVNRRPKVWTLRLDASTESFNGVERAGDVQTAYTGRSVRS